MAPTISLTGISGKTYQYAPCDVNGVWNPVPGNYVFIGQDGRPKYVGQTSDFSSRRPGPGHEKWNLAIRHGAVAVYAHANHGGENMRLAEERDLIQSYNPPANTQHRPTGLGGAGFGLGAKGGRKGLLGGS